RRGALVTAGAVAARRAPVPRALWLAPLLAGTLLPFAWMLAISLSGVETESLARALRGPFGLAHYRSLFGAAGLPRYLANSALVASAVVALNVATAAMAGWVLGRRRVPGERLWTLGIVATLMLPKQALMIPLY